MVLNEMLKKLIYSNHLNNCLFSSYHIEKKSCSCKLENLTYVFLLVKSHFDWLNTQFTICPLGNAGTKLARAQSCTGQLSMLLHFIFITYFAKVSVLIQRES